MPITYETKGSGLTKRRVRTVTGTVGTVTISVGGDAGGQTKDPLKWITDIGDGCRACLRDHGLPDQYQSYVLSDGNWIHVEDDGKARAENPYIKLCNLETVVLSTHQEDSHPDFAARILGYLWLFEVSYKRHKGDGLWFLWHASRLSTEWRMKTLYDRQFKHGEKMDPHGKNINEHNRKREEKLRLRDMKISELRNVMLKNTAANKRKMSMTKIAETIQRKLAEAGDSVSVKTVQRSMQKQRS